MGDMSDMLELQALEKQLSSSVKLLRQNGTIFAQAERDYKVALSKEALNLRAKEDMAVTLIDKVIYGIPSIAALRLKRDIAEVTYKANQEAINSIKLRMRLIDNQISREWGSNE